MNTNRPVALGFFLHALVTPSGSGGAASFAYLSRTLLRNTYSAIDTVTNTIRAGYGMHEQRTY